MIYPLRGSKVFDRDACHGLLHPIRIGVDPVLCSTNHTMRKVARGHEEDEGTVSLRLRKLGRIVRQRHNTERTVFLQGVTAVRMGVNDNGFVSLSRENRPDVVGWTSRMHDGVH